MTSTIIAIIHACSSFPVLIFPLISLFIAGQSFITYCKFVIGNSSSGIIEVPYFKIPTINIGDRQHGRFRHDSIISCNVVKKDLNTSIKKAISLKFNYQISKMKLYFGKGNASKKILNFILKNIKNNNKLIYKKFRN